MSFELDPENISTWYFEKAFNDTYPGTQIFVRDCNLTPEQLSKYEVGKVIREPGFIDSAHRVMGIG